VGTGGIGEGGAELELDTVTVLWLPYILVTLYTDIVTVRTPITYNNCTVATVHIGKSVH